MKSVVNLQKHLKAFCHAPVVFGVLCAACIAWSCSDHKSPYSGFEPPEFDSSAVYAVVEIPAGSSQLRQYDTLSKRVELLPEADHTGFLPFPANFGFIASTYQDPISGGNGAPLPALILSDHLPVEKVLQVSPIATLRLAFDQNPSEIIIAVPTDDQLQTVRAESFVDFYTRYEGARFILQQWFLHFRGYGSVELIGWEDEQYAENLIKKWRIE